MGKTSALNNVLHEFDGVLLNQVSGLHSVETYPIAGSLEKLVADGGPIELVTSVDAVLHATKTLTIDLPLIEQATNAEELLKFVIDKHYKPFQETLAHAVAAATLQWRSIVDGQ